MEKSRNSGYTTLTPRLFDLLSLKEIQKWHMQRVVRQQKSIINLKVKWINVDFVQEYDISHFRCCHRFHKSLKIDNFIV